MEKNNVSKFHLPKELDDSNFTRGALDDILVHCSESGASDITFQSGQYIFIDVSGKFYKINSHQLTTTELEEFSSKLYRADSIRSKIKAGEDADGSYDIRHSRSKRFRYRYNISAIDDKGTDGIQITCRTIDAIPPTIEKLDLEQEIIDNIKPRQGIVAVVGPTGSGKSTLLAAVIRNMLEEEEGNRKVLTFESPIEYVYDSVFAPSSVIAQSEVPRHIPNFASAIRNSLRRKPDVILIGESRDAETIGESITASMTGHAVYTTVHSNGVAATINRMINAFGEGEKNAKAMDLIGSMQMIVCQNLLPSTDGKRVAIREYLVFDDDITDYLLEAGIDNVNMATRKILKEKGKTFYQSAMEVYEKGLITEEVLNRIRRADRGVEMDMESLARKNIKKADKLRQAKDFNEDTSSEINFTETDDEFIEDYDFTPFEDPELKD